MSINDPDWDTMLAVAKMQQQEYYELFPEWTIYETRDYKYLKQNIGFAMYGPPTAADDSDNIEDIRTVQCVNRAILASTDITERLDYKPEAMEKIDACFEKIREFGEGSVGEGKIYYGLIYNITFRTKSACTSTTSVKEEETKAHNEHEQSTNGDNNNEEPAATISLQILPIFKIKKKCVEEVVINSKTVEKTTYATWYIDVGNRVYKTWDDYKSSNTLPPCTMVIPKDGVYQANPTCNMTEESSDVWLEIEDSPACQLINTILSGVDITSNVMSVVGMGVGIASIVTPVGPAILTASLVSAGVNSLWTIGRATQQLVDRSIHEESISPTNSAALSSWLGIAGSTVGLATGGGALLLSRAAQSGSTISNSARLAYNAALIGSLGVNGAGIAHQIYCMYTKYQREGTVDPIDVVFLASHVLFFGNAVLNLQFAGELIESSQGKVLDDYKASIRTKRLRKAFNRAKRNAAANNLDTISENAEVIRYINRKKDFQVQLSTNLVDPTKTNAVTLRNGNITINGVPLIDPRVYVARLIALRVFDTSFNFADDDNLSTEESNDDNNTMETLNKLLIDLLTELLLSGDVAMENIPVISNFESILQEIAHVKDPKAVLSNLFKIAVTLIRRSDTLADFLVIIMRFLWNYLKANLQQHCMRSCSLVKNKTLQDVLMRIVIVISEGIDMIVNSLISALHDYISEVSSQPGYNQFTTS